MPGRAISPCRVPQARLRAHRAQRPEGLSRRRHRLALADRDAAPRGFCDKGDSRHLRVARRRGPTGSRSTISTFPPAATSPTPRSTTSSPTSSPSSTRWRNGSREDQPPPAGRSWSATSTSRRSNTTSGATRRSSTSSATRRSKSRSCTAPRRPAPGPTRCAASCRRPEALHVVELSLARLGQGRQGPPPRPRLGEPGARRRRELDAGAARRARLGAPLRSRAGDRRTGALGCATAKRPGGTTAWRLVNWAALFLLALVVVAIAAARISSIAPCPPIPARSPSRPDGGRASGATATAPHIFAANLDDAARALGYLHASERLYQMEIKRRVGQGRDRRDRRRRSRRSTASSARSASTARRRAASPRCRRGRSSGCRPMPTASTPSSTAARCRPSSSSSATT